MSCQRRVGWRDTTPRASQSHAYGHGCGQPISGISAAACCFSVLAGVVIGLIAGWLV